MDQVMTAATEMDALIPEIWSAAFYPTLKEKLPFISSVSLDYENEIQNLGDTVNIMSFPQFSQAEEISENAAVDADAITVSKIQLIINKQVAKDFIITKKALKQSMEAQAALRDLALHAILKKMQSVIIAEIVPSAASPDHAIAFDSGTTLALADALEAKELLDDADVEEAGRVMCLGSAQYNDLWNIAGFVSKDYQAASPMSAGNVTLPFLGFDVKWSSEVGNVSYLFHPSFLNMAVQQMPSVEVVSLGSEGKRATRVNMDVLFGVKQCSNLRVVTIG